MLGSKTGQFSRAAVFAAALLGGFAASASAFADWHGRGYWDHHHRWHAWHHWAPGGYYPPPPVVYGGGYYAPPPVVVGPGFGVNVHIR